LWVFDGDDGMTRVIKVLLLVLLGVGVALPTAYTTFIHSERSVLIGAHQATVAPDFTGYARIDTGPVLPSVRLPVDAPLSIGLEISLGAADVNDLNELIARDAVIASQPKGEIATVKSTITSMAVDAVLRALGAAILAVLLAVLVWKGVGPQRRRLIRAALRHPSPRRGLAIGGVALLTLAALVLVAVPERPKGDGATWAPIEKVFPQLPQDPVLDTLQIAEGASTNGSRALVESAFKTYRDSVSFYGKLAVAAKTVDVRLPEEGETTALVVTDRHDNIGMDPVARAVADRAQAHLLIDLGDDTSNGASWEGFSLNSLAREFKGFDVVSVAGNHDQGRNVRKQMLAKGFHLLTGKPMTVDGIRFLGSSDPRSSGYTAGYNGNESDNIAAIHSQDASLTKTACADGNVSVIAVHSPSSAKKAAASGCTDLVLSGHLHRQIGPAVLDGTNGRSTTTLTTGTTGGAIFAFALGSKLRHTAQVTVVTFKDGLPVGLQPVSFEQGGAITIEPYTPITTSPR
jgi:predicted phosphodiesterase